MFSIFLFTCKYEIVFEVTFDNQKLTDHVRSKTLLNVDLIEIRILERNLDASIDSYRSWMFNLWIPRGVGQKRIIYLFTKSFSERNIWTGFLIWVACWPKFIILYWCHDSWLCARSLGLTRVKATFFSFTQRVRPLHVIGVR